MAFNNYLEDENDKPYFTTNSLAYYYDKMEGFAEKVEGSAKALNLTKEEIEKRIALRLAEWDKNLESFDGSVEKLLTEWVDDGTLTPLIDSTLIDQKIAPVTAQLNEKLTKGTGSVDTIDLSQAVKEQLTGGSVAVVGVNAVGSENVKPKAIDGSKTTFIETGKNKFEGNYIAASVIVSLPDVSTMTFRSSTAGTARLAIVPIEPFKTYTISVIGTHNRFRIGVHNSYPEIKDTDTPVDRPLYANDTQSKYTFTNDGNGKFLLVAVSTISEQPLIQVEEGGYVTEYEANSYKIKNLAKKSVGFTHLGEDVTSKIIPFEKGKNLFNGKYSSDGLMNYDETTGVMSFRRDTTGNARVAIIPLETGETYTVQTYGEHNRFLLGIMNQYPVFPSTYAPVDHFVYRNSEHEGAYTFINTGGGKYLLVYVSNQSEEPRMMIEKGTVASKYESFGYKIDLIEDDVVFEQPYYLLDDIQGIYEKPSDLVSVAEGEPFELINSKHTDIYAVYDNLVATFPDHVTKKLLGYDTANLPIYQYHFQPKTSENTTLFELKKIKIAVTSAVHGYEQLSAWSTAHFFRDLCHNHEEKEQLKFMWWNVDFVVVPVCNPYGYDNDQRKNMNDIDLNRNFPSKWKKNGTSADEYYTGEAPASEIETQIIMAFLDDHSDADFHIDHHNIAGGYPLVYAGTEWEANAGMNVFRTLTRKWIENYPQAPTNRIQGLIKSSSGEGTMTSYGRTVTKSITLESTWTMPFATAKYDKTSVECAVDLFGNFVTLLLKSMK